MRDRAPSAAAGMTTTTPAMAGPAPDGAVLGKRPATQDEDRPHRHPAPQQSRPAGWDTGVRRILWENGLSLVLLAMFLLTIVGQVATGMRAYNQEQREHGRPLIGLVGYLVSGHFIEATAENWESEFLQMGMFVVLTVFLRQKGSAESKRPDGQEEVDEDPRDYAGDPGVPWPVRRGGAILWLYSNSLSIVFIVLFLFSFLAHAWGGAREYSRAQVAHGDAPVGVLQFMGTSEFWFQSFQNWQSEFLSIAAMVIFTIWLRQYGSPESKPVHWPHARTASE